MIFQEQGSLSAEGAAKMLSCEVSTIERLEKLLVHRGYLVVLREWSDEGVQIRRRTRPEAGELKPSAGTYT